MTSYDPYGQPASGAVAADTPIGFAGSYADAESGLLYLVNRYYDPTTGQFTSVDPALALTQSPFAYVNDNPLNGVDPLGLFCWSAGCLLNDAGAVAEVTTVVATVAVIGASVVATGGADAPLALGAMDVVSTLATAAKLANVAQTGFQCSAVLLHGSTLEQCGADVLSVAYGEGVGAGLDSLGIGNPAERALYGLVPSIPGFGSDLPIYGSAYSPTTSVAQPACA